MSAVEFTGHSESGKGHAVWRYVSRHGSAIAWLMSAAILMFVVFVCTTIRVRDSFLDAFHLQLLVAALSSIAATHLLMAFGIREKAWHVCSWIAVAVTWFLILWLT